MVSPKFLSLKSLKSPKIIYSSIHKSFWITSFSWGYCKFPQKIPQAQSINSNCYGSRRGRGFILFNSCSSGIRRWSDVLWSFLWLLSCSNSNSCRKIGGDSIKAQTSTNKSHDNIKMQGLIQIRVIRWLGSWFLIIWKEHKRKNKNVNIKLPT